MSDAPETTESNDAPETTDAEVAPLAIAPEEDSNAIRLKPKPLKIGEEDGFAEKHDLFGYAKFGEKLGRLFINAPDLDVAVLDDEWGCGKTIFAKQWAGHMRNQGQLVVEIDAFANDYQDDPFNLLVLEILAASGSSIGKDFVDVATKLGRSILLNTAEVMTAGAVKADDIEAALKEKYEGAEKAKGEVDEFKEQLASIAGNKKLIVVVDELDRCRPDFAIRFIERIKHFFDVPNVSFLLITSKTHLASMVGVLYGFDAATSEKYLSKFIDVSVRLPSNTNASKDRLEAYAAHLTGEAMPGDKHANSRYSIVENIYGIAKAFGMSLRDVEKVYSIFCLVCLTANFPIAFRVSVLAFASLKVCSPDLYQKAKRGGKVWTGIAEEFGRSDDLEDLISNFSPDKEYALLQLAALLSESKSLAKTINDAEGDLHAFAHACNDHRIFVSETRHINRDRYVEMIINLIEDGDFSI